MKEIIATLAGAFGGYCLCLARFKVKAYLAAKAAQAVNEIPKP